MSELKIRTRDLVSKLLPIMEDHDQSFVVRMAAAVDLAAGFAAVAQRRADLGKMGEAPNDEPYWDVACRQLAGSARGLYARLDGEAE